MSYKMGPQYIYAQEHITITITLKGIEKIKTEKKNNNKTV